MSGGGGEAALVISDLDGVLLDFHPERRLRHLAGITGLPAEAIHAAIWASDFETAAEAGAYRTGEAYLAAFNARLGTRVTRAEWIAARRLAMGPRDDVLAYLRRVAARTTLALLTNNGALLLESLPLLAPAVAGLFGDRLHASCEFGARKPDPAVYTRLLLRLGVPAASAVFIDDSRPNVDGARAAGLRGIVYEDLPQLEAALTPLLPPPR